MSEQEIKTFNVKNVSLRLVGFAGESILPNEVVTVVDDEKGINRKSVERDPFIDFTDEEPTKENRLDISIKPSVDMGPDEVEKQVARNTPQVGSGTKKAATSTPAAKTASGNGWTKK